ncbi:MAG: metal ABC transporter permease [Planctomycetaceae bacterium]|nr:metal ABC transporter permease [Planctomycetales bacterium]MCB9923582.1 metal ABC transporter permease [Planctomycetaceae bacterium]
MNSVPLRIVFVAMILAVWLGQHQHLLAAAQRHPNEVRSAPRSLARDRLEWPTADDVKRTLLLSDYNTRIVAIGTTMLGVAAAIVGVFMLLRRRSLLGDVVSHSTLPGIAIAFLVMETMKPGGGKWLPGLLTGALIAGLAGILCTKLILRYTRIKEDAALAIVLSVFFGAGMSLFKAVQYIPSGSQAGLNHFILGKAASMVAADVWVIGEVSLGIVVIIGLLFKEFSLLSFDDKFAASQGWPVFRLDLLLMLLVAGVTVIGLQSVGLLLVVAMLITPAAAARFWSDRLGRTTLVAAILGGGGAFSGVLISAMYPRLAAGPVIVLTGVLFFVVSMMFGTRRGAIIRFMTHRQLKAAVGRQHILRALFEFLEPRCNPELPTSAQLVEHIVTADDLQPMRSWTGKRLRHLLRIAESSNFITAVREGGYRLTTRGAELAHRVVRNHRLWELYLIEYADIAPSHVDRDADDIEHLLGPDVVESLERLLSERYPHMTVPPSPHLIDANSDTAKRPSVS